MEQDYLSKTCNKRVHSVVLSRRTHEAILSILSESRRIIVISISITVQETGVGLVIHEY